MCIRDRFLQLSDLFFPLFNSSLTICTVLQNLLLLLIQTVDFFFRSPDILLQEIFLLLFLCNLQQNIIQILGNTLNLQIFIFYLLR